MKNILSLLFLVIVTFSLASCQSSDSGVLDHKDSSFTLNGAGE